MNTFNLLLYFFGEDTEEHFHPEYILGPNYKAVLDFWTKIDNLTEDQAEKFYKLCDRKNDWYVMGYDDWREARSIAWNKIFVDDITDIATYELMAMPFLLKQAHKLVFVPLIEQLAS